MAVTSSSPSPLGPPASAETVPARAAIDSPLSLVTPGVATSPSVSGDGRFVAFVAPPADADPEVPDPRRATSVWLTDRLTGELDELTFVKDGTRLGNSINPVLAADGCSIVITTETAYDLFRDDDVGARWDVYRTTLPFCGAERTDWVLVSTSSNDDRQATARNDVSSADPAAVSGAGSVVAYVRSFGGQGAATASPAADDGKVGQAAGAIDVVDLSVPIDDPSRISEAPGLPTPSESVPGNHAGHADPTLSADGSTLVFSSDATSDNAVPEWTGPVGASGAAVTQIYVWDREEADPFEAVTLVSTNGSQAGDASSADPTVSSDGRVIAFSSSAANLVAADSLRQCNVSCPSQIYVSDRGPAGADALTVDVPPTLELISHAPDVAGAPVVVGNGASFAPALSADGISLAFSTQATNLSQVQTPGGGAVRDGDLLIADLANAAQLRRAFDLITPAAGAHGHPQMSANGRVLVAETLVAGQLVADPSLDGRHIVAATYKPSLSLASIDMGTIMVSVPGPEWQVYVVNNGPGSFQPAVEGVTVDNADFTITGGSCVTDHAPVKPGTSCDVKVVFTPSVIGSSSATLAVAEEGFGGITITGSLNGQGGEPTLGATPSFAVYGSEQVGHLSQFTEIFQVANVSMIPTLVMSATVGGAHKEDFVIISSTCGSLMTLAATCPVEVGFRPTGSGRRTAVLSFFTPLGQYTSVLLSGDGVYVPQLLSNPTVKPGQDLGVGGTGFPSGTVVVLGWSDGSGLGTTVTTDATGAFLTNLPTKRGQPAGIETLVAQTADGISATVTVEVEREARRTPRRRR